jgi:hypothetical protein
MSLGIKFPKHELLEGEEEHIQTIAILTSCFTNKLSEVQRAELTLSQG